MTARRGYSQRRLPLGLGVGEGCALNRLPLGGESEGAGETSGVGRAEPFSAPMAWLEATAGGWTGLGQAVRLAGAPASTGTAVGRIPQPVASAAVTAAPTSASAQRPT
ncbi:hypothetical protein [Kitasatospora azatica]|uniref:hypothetical protein n=1 Tax=Kitasatospora azatica TaxID=58347 RepID=UPI000562C842|nr:hypothetical protein [Kitasatospora azatica]